MEVNKILIFLASSLFLALISLPTLLLAQVYPPSVGVERWKRVNPLLYEQGFILGAIAEASRQGIVKKTFEGEIHLGKDSTSAKEEDLRCARRIKEESNFEQLPNSQKVVVEQRIEDTCVSIITPVRLSAFDGMIEKTMQYIDEMVVVKYYHYTADIPFANTQKIIQDIYPTNKNYQIPQFLKAGDPPIRGISVEDGFYPGRIVKAAFVGQVVKEHYEVTIQIGSSGNDFIAMSVNSVPLFQYLVDTMLTGREINIYFYKLSSIPARISAFFTGANTSYRVYGAELIELKEAGN